MMSERGPAMFASAVLPLEDCRGRSAVAWSRPGGRSAASGGSLCSCVLLLLRVGRRTRGFYAAALPASKGRPLRHMAWSTTTSLRATATLARLKPMRSRSAVPQRRIALSVLARVRM